MGRDRTSQIREELQSKSTEKLLRIRSGKDRHTWSDEELQVAEELLRMRGEDLSQTNVGRGGFPIGTVGLVLVILGALGRVLYTVRWLSGSRLHPIDAAAAASNAQLLVAAVSTVLLLLGAVASIVAIVSGKGRATGILAVLIGALGLLLAFCLR